jgi:signal transduction histidine kinase
LKGNPGKRLEYRVDVLDPGRNDTRLYVWADDMLSEVFTNIFGNSFSYTDSSQVRIAVEIVETSADNYTHSEKAEGEGYWRISISDWGSGISPALKEKIFDRYMGSARGSGLGLSIAFTLVVERYGGKIELRDRVPNDYSKGTMVEILLPKANYSGS